MASSRAERAKFFPPVTIICKHCNNVKKRKKSGNVVCYVCANNYNFRKRQENPDLFRKKRKEREAGVGVEGMKERRRKYRKNQHYLYRTWLDINYKCHNPSHFSYKYYGKKGRSVYPEWRKILGKRGKEIARENKDRFEKFVEYIETYLGPRPEGFSLDRYPDYNGNYEPNNLRWATPKQQSNNTLVNLKSREEIYLGSLVMVNGRLESLASIARITGIEILVVRDRYALHGTIESITNQNRLVQRKYLYKNHLYSANELALFSGIPYATIVSRIKNYRWSVEKAVSTPVIGNIEFYNSC